MKLHVHLITLSLLFISVSSLDSLPRDIHFFFYIWYGNPENDGAYFHWNHAVLPHWTDQVNQMYPQIGERFTPPHHLHSPYYPAKGRLALITLRSMNCLGPYSSKDPIVLNKQFDEIIRAGGHTLVISWWGQANKASSTDTQGRFRARGVPTNQ
jgi:hypothetical protein